MNKKDIFSITVLIMTISILLYLLVFAYTGLTAMQTMIHEQKIEELNLEKEIALINNNDKYLAEYPDLDLLLRGIDKINEDCGEPHIAKRYGSNDWSVFIWEKATTNPYLEIKECYKE
jgi:Tfp pilus assembly protein PilN